MTIMTKASLLAVALSIGGTAYAQNNEAVPAPPGSYPVCSNTITDECINRDAAPRAILHKAAMRRRAPRIAHRTVKTAHRTASKTAATKPEARS